jgi:hypothetical protein
MNMLKLYIIFLQTSHLAPYKNLKINLSQLNPLFFEGLILKFNGL